MRVRPVGWLGVAFLLLSIITAAQAPTPPPRAPEPTGTGRIRGRVLAADSGVPLRRAYVRVSAPDLRIQRGAATDADGRYDIGDLPRGRYSIFVSRNGYVSLQFGQQRAFEPGRPLDLGEGQLMDRIDFALPRGGVIVGRITDELGEPIAGARMQAWRYQYLPSGQRRLTPTSGGPLGAMLTNDLGEFRLFGLMPGAYVVSAIFDDPSRMATAPTPNPEGFGVTYYPGTLNSDEAQPVTVGIGEEAMATFALVPGRMTRISGVVRDSLGRPLAEAIVGLRTLTGGGFMMSRSSSGALGADGAFVLSNVPPGEHFVEVIPRSAEEEWASVPITVASADITGLVITTTAGATLSGQVIFEGTSSAPKPTRVTASAPDPGGFILSRTTLESGTIDASGRFQLKGLGGRILLRTTPPGVTAPSNTWSIKSVTYNGVDITDTPLDVATAGDLSGFEIVFTDKQTTVSGTVRNARGVPVEDYVVAIFPSQLKEGAIPVRFTRTARPDQEGRYQTRGLPTGDYFAVAVPALEQGGEWDPAFRRQVEPTAKRFKLTEGQTLSLDLQLIP